MDPSNDYQFLNEILGKTVKITLKCGIFQGVLQHVDASRSIVLNRVKNLENGRSVPGAKMFFGYEIVNGEDFLSSAQKGWGHGCFCMVNTLKGLMLHIKKQNVFSVAAEGVHLCRHGKLCWLQVATRTRVFLFDIFLLGARVFKNGLQMALEDKKILKVIHDCRWLSDCLSHQYGIVLSNVFDTQVADVVHFSRETGGFLPHCISTLQECLMRHLKMPSRWVSFMELRQSAVQKNPEIWFVRPLPSALLKVLALETLYLLPLRLFLLDEMMSDFTTFVDGYLNAYREGSADQLGSTESSCIALPQELHQLADFQTLRRERALQTYEINEEGFLVRPSVESKGTDAAMKERKQGNDNGSIPSERASLCKTSSAGFVHLQDPFGHENYSQQDNKVYCWDSSQAGIGSRNSVSEIVAEASQVTWKEPPICRPQMKGTLSLQEERLLLMRDKAVDLPCSKQTPTFSFPAPKQSSSFQNSFHAVRLPSPSVLSPCQSLDSTGLQQKHSSQATAGYSSRFPVMPEREGTSTVRFAFPPHFGCRMPTLRPSIK
uniref:Exonuclease 3'-5' domain containing 1 n=1 Tax=Sphenodon punctatus TaxID=8508 RepID=A0A8D0L288_SPHPU